MTESLLYFQVKYITKTKRNPAEDEVYDKIFIADIGKAAQILKEQGNQEFRILERIDNT